MKEKKKWLISIGVAIVVLYGICLITCIYFGVFMNNLKRVDLDVNIESYRDYIDSIKEVKEANNKNESSIINDIVSDINNGSILVHKFYTKKGLIGVDYIIIKDSGANRLQIGKKYLSTDSYRNMKDDKWSITSILIKNSGSSSAMMHDVSGYDNVTDFFLENINSLEYIGKQDNHYLYENNKMYIIIENGEHTEIIKMYKDSDSIGKMEVHKNLSNSDMEVLEYLNNSVKYKNTLDNFVSKLKD